MLETSKKNFHEIGFYDLPAMINHVLAKSGTDKLTYVGLSQACPAFMVMSALRPEYSKKIVLANFLAPVTAYAAKTKFAYFNYYEQNQDVYDQDVAPVYDITNVTTPLAIYFGKADILANVEGIYRQYKLMQNVVLYYRVESNDFNHMDFVYAKDLNKHLNNKVIETIDVYNKPKI
ncbi:unnamed protein product [Ceutorhynchus assimilis]|uniref:Uncharacterized protein n=1 Tax=Ceutorhynchus assimilis TaxID=467358 RepID=A0A9N9QQW7_9CUCU|nr:unnamed protein product [Ceutorhynchus assimilis]